jgi:hypothetical protein
MAEKPTHHPSEGQDLFAVDYDRDVNLARREALAKLGQYAAAGYVAPTMLTLLVSKKASAASGLPPPPPG